MGRSVAVLNLFDPGHEKLELAHFTDADLLGESILKVAEASLRIDQLRWLHSTQTPVRFTDKVVRRLVIRANEYSPTGGYQTQICRMADLLALIRVVGRPCD